MFKPDNQLINFFYRLFILIIVLILFDQIIGAALNYFYFKQKAGLAYRTTYSIDSTKADILIFGSSRANHHYVPSTFENGLNMKYYNTGRDGCFIFFNYAIFKAIVSRYSPKIVVIDLNLQDLIKTADGYDRLSALLPYYSTHPEIRSIVNLRGRYEKIKLLSRIYPYNSSILTIAIGNLEINKKRKQDIQGFVPLYGKMDDNKLVPLVISSNEIDSTKTQALDAISKICFEKKINMYVCFSPIYSLPKKTKVDSVVLDLAKVYHFKYYDFSNDLHFIEHPELFRDQNHLNVEGANLYSSMVVDSILMSTGVSQILK